jgi:Predicted ATPase involved in replication control, Cdc46/Mcm family
MSKTQTSTFTDSALSDKVKDFLVRFKDKNGIYKYVEEIDEMMPKNAKYIIVDYNDLVTEPEIEIIFSENPDRLFDAFSRAIKEALQTRFPDYAEKIKDEFRARLINFPLERSLRQINAETIGHITSVSGMVVRASEVKPLAKELIFVCADEHTTKVIQLKGMDVKTPVVCDNPNCKQRDFDLKPEASKFIDFQILRLQELPEDLPPGQLPHYIDVTIRQDLVDNSRPGDRIILTGVVRVEQESVAGIQRGHSGLYRLRIEGNNIEFFRWTWFKD